MRTAIALYKGGKPVEASEGDHEIARELGLVCPFCYQAVFWSQAYQRSDGVKVSAAWRHHKAKDGEVCENRAASTTGRKMLEGLGAIAQGQRLKLFNQRFWDLFSYQKDVPPNLKKAVKAIAGLEVADHLVKHCRDRWNVPEILKILPERSIIRREDAAQHFFMQKLFEEYPDRREEFLETVVRERVSLFDYKVSCEAITWLKSSSAQESFRKVIYLAILDCAEIIPPPIHSTHVAQMAIALIAQTPWEEAIAYVQSHTKGVGFC